MFRMTTMHMQTLQSHLYSIEIFRSQDMRANLSKGIRSPLTNLASAVSPASYSYTIFSFWGQTNKRTDGMYHPEYANPLCSGAVIEHFVDYGMHGILYRMGNQNRRGGGVDCHIPLLGELWFLLECHPKERCHQQWLPQGRAQLPS
jgi:hypothetical protein